MRSAMLAGTRLAKPSQSSSLRAVPDAQVRRQQLLPWRLYSEGQQHACEVASGTEVSEAGAACVTDGFRHWEPEA
jgi:hypothetical protein